MTTQKTNHSPAHKKTTHGIYTTRNLAIAFVAQLIAAALLAATALPAFANYQHVYESPVAHVSVDASRFAALTTAEGACALTALQLEPHLSSSSYNASENDPANETGIASFSTPDETYALEDGASCEASNGNDSSNSSDASDSNSATNIGNTTDALDATNETGAFDSGDTTDTTAAKDTSTSGDASIATNTSNQA